MVGLSRVVQLAAQGPHAAHKGLNCSLWAPAWLPLLPSLWLKQQLESLGFPLPPLAFVACSYPKVHPGELRVSLGLHRCATPGSWGGRRVHGEIRGDAHGVLFLEPWLTLE